ncbi:MAG: hypothetical protein FMNOHCHN_03041 [Ignavibacteriaceae bacterium]|nr:hypothetical protein [Ignavibacteriaceae bacterium]
MRIVNKLLLLLLFLVLRLLPAEAASGLVKGRVADAETGELLPYVNVFIQGTNKGTVTDPDGNYYLKIPYGSYTLTYSMVGYKTETRQAEIGTEPLTIDVFFQRAEYAIPEVVVTGEDPGVLIMRNAIKRKLEQKDKLNTYTYNLYTKFVVSSDTLTAGRSSQRGDTTIFSIFESYSAGYFQKPDNYFNRITHRRQSVNVPPQANFVAFGTNINIYDDQVLLLDELIYSPFHPDAPEYYHFTLEKWIKPDSVTMIARIRVEPASSQRKLFSGYVDINGATGRVLEASLKPNKAVQLPFSADLSYWQSFGEFDGYIVPTGLHIKAIVPVDIYWIFDARVDISIYTVAYDYTFNQKLDEALFAMRRVEIDKNADELNADYWDDNAVLPLREEEKYAYEEIRQLRENPDSVLTSTFFDRYIGPVTREIAKLDRAPFSGFDDFFRFNRTGGVYTGAGFRYQPAEGINTVTKAGYSFADKKLHGDFRAEYSFDEAGQSQFIGSLYSRLNRRDDPNSLRERTITLLSLLSKNDYGDYYYSSGYSFELKYGIGQLRFIRREAFERPTVFTLGFRDETHLPAAVNTDFAFFGRGREYRGNPAAVSGRLRSLYSEVMLNYSPARRIGNAGLYISIETADKKRLTGDFTFTNLRSAVYLRTRTLPLWMLDLRVSGGYSNGELPVQRYYSFESASAAIALPGALRGIKEKEFYGDRFATLFAEHNFGELIPGVLRIPNVAAYGIEVIVNGSIAWSDIRNRSAVQSANPQLKTTAETSDRYYYEAGVGFNRLLIFFRFDISARLSQVSGPSYRLTFSTATN